MLPFTLSYLHIFTDSTLLNFSEMSCKLILSQEFFCFNFLFCFFLKQCFLYMRLASNLAIHRKAGPELNLLPLSPKCWNYRRVYFAQLLGMFWNQSVHEMEINNINNNHFLKHPLHKQNFQSAHKLRFYNNLTRHE